VITKKNAFKILYGEWKKLRKKFDKKIRGYKVLRDWQEEAYHKMKDSIYWAVFAPMGAGKSLLIHALNYYRLLKNPKLRSIVAVPQAIIAQSFDPEKINTSDGDFDCVASHNFFDSSESSINGLLNFLSKTPSVDVCDRMALCSHSALVQAFQKKPNLFKDVLITIDEIHHSQFIEMGQLDTVITNGLGRLIHHALSNPKKNIQLGVTTATFFRGDNYSVIPKKYLNKFKTYEYAFDRHLNENCQFDSFTYDFLLYKSCYTEALENIFKKEVPKTVIFIPHVASTLSKGKNKDVIEIYKTLSLSDKPILKESKEEPGLTLLKRGNKWLKIVNLVDENLREEKKALVKKAHDSDSPDTIDIILALGMFKEGANWKWAEEVAVIGPKGSLQELIQIIGRLFRPAKNKKEVKINHILPFTIECFDKKETLENFNDYLKAVLLSMLFEDIFTPPSLVFNENKNPSTPNKPNVNHLSKIPVDVLNNVRMNTILECAKRNAHDENFNKNKETLKKEVQGIIKKYLKIEGVTKNINSVTEQIWNNLSKHAVDSSNSINLRKIDVNIVYEDPSNILLAFISKDCGYNTLQELREQYALFKDRNTKESVEYKKKLLSSKLTKKPTESSKDISTRRLSYAFTKYISKNNSSYDPSFDQEIRNKKPNWFIDLNSEYKKKLLSSKMTKKPSQLSKNSEEKKLAFALIRYLNKNSPSYDSVFDRDIRNKKPQWFKDITSEYKKKLLSSKMVNKPDIKTKIGAAFYRYTGKNNPSYDSNFDKEIRNKKPQWFRDANFDYKNKLLSSKMVNKPEPSSKNKDESNLYHALKRYLNKNSSSYDSNFKLELKSKKPLWFVDVNVKNKNRLLSSKMKKKPSGYSKYPEEKKLYYALVRYLNKKCASYDSAFEKELKLKKPQWFTDVSSEYKKKLLDSKTVKKPNRSSKKIEEKRIYHSFIRYINKNSSYYDPEFTKKLKAKKPHWFSRG
jgi:superfamily II DNA or RNA helicase